jgi:hypothetical protein
MIQSIALARPVGWGGGRQEIKHENRSGKFILFWRFRVVTKMGRKHCCSIFLRSWYPNFYVYDYQFDCDSNYRYNISITSFEFL